MKKVLIWLIPLLMVGSLVVAWEPTDGMDEPWGIPFDPTLKGHGTLEPNNEEPVNTRPLSKTKYCRLDKKDCEVKLKIGKQTKLKVENNRYYLRYLGRDKFRLSDSNFNLLEPDKKWTTLIIKDEGSFTTNSGDTIYYTETTRDRDVYMKRLILSLNKPIEEVDNI